MRVFPNFPKDTKCPICGTNEDKKCFLLPIDNAQNKNICEVQPTHVDCVKLETFRLNKECKLIYRKIK